MNAFVRRELFFPITLLRQHRQRPRIVYKVYRDMADDDPVYFKDRDEGEVYSDLINAWRPGIADQDFGF